VSERRSNFGSKVRQQAAPNQWAQPAIQELSVIHKSVSEERQSQNEQGKAEKIVTHNMYPTFSNKQQLVALEDIRINMEGSRAQQPDSHSNPQIELTKQDSNEGLCLDEKRQKQKETQGEGFTEMTKDLSNSNLPRRKSGD